MARPRTSTAVPSAAELYPKSPLGWMYDHTVGWALDHKLASTAVAIAASLLQDVPELANYQSALDYTSQRMVDMENVYGLSLDQVRAPVAKWVQANIDWDKKGERSVAFSEEIDFIPNDLIFKNVTTDRSRDIGAAQSIKNVADRFIFNTEWMMQEHDNTWREVNDPKIVEKAFEYLEALAQPGVLYEGVGASFPPYVKAIREKGTFEDKAHWSLYVKGRKNAPDEIRQHVGLGYILSVGGDAKIEIWGFGNYTDKSGKTRSGDGHGDLAVAMSPELRKYIESDPATFGHLLDTEYLGILPSREGVEAQGTLGTNNGVKFVVIWRELPSKRLGTPNRTFIYGDEAIARANGHR
ncbi:MAG: hypothetical protein HY051_00770 [Candidatus Aenigmarchaeota archaeon]|nr:hypothetical protein [Candidatus Aenigmarchaeota archaeon]